MLIQVFFYDTFDNTILKLISTLKIKHEEKMRKPQLNDSDIQLEMGFNKNRRGASLALLTSIRLYLYYFQQQKNNNFEHSPSERFQSCYHSKDPKQFWLQHRREKNHGKIRNNEN